MLSRLSNQGKIPIARIVSDAINEYLSKISSIEKLNPLSNIIALGESGEFLGSLRHDHLHLSPIDIALKKLSLP